MADQAREQAIAARLTAIAERLRKITPKQFYVDHDMVNDCRWLLAHVETLTQQVADWAATNEVIRQDFEDAKEENARLTAELQAFQERQAREDKATERILNRVADEAERQGYRDGRRDERNV